MVIPATRRFIVSFAIATAVAILPAQAQRAAAPRAPQFDVYEKTILDLKKAMESASYDAVLQLCFSYVDVD